MWIYKSALSCESFLSSDSEYNRKYLYELCSEYGELKNAEIPALTEELFGEYERSGSRIGYEKPYFLRRAMLRDFALKAWLGDNDAIELLEKIIDAICSERTWALPAHIGDSKIDSVIDLFAAETAQSLTEIVSLLGDRLSRKTSEHAADEVKRRVLLPFINRADKYNWETMESNWCAVCGGCVGMTAVYLIEDTDKVKRVTRSLEPVFENYMKSFSDDGACLEGLYYWGYGMTYLTAFLELYRERVGGDFPVNYEKLEKMADFANKCCISDGITVSFSDAVGRDRIYSGLSARLTKLYGANPVQNEYKAYFLGDDCGRWCRAARDIAWNDGGGDAAGERVSILPDAQWAVIRGKNISFALKGGSNGEPHNHNDIGSFIAVKDGEVILCDLGAGEYTRDYFSENRYGIFCSSSLGHSVPVINGLPQMVGREYAAKDFSANEKYASAEISGAYSVRELKKCMRSLELSDNMLKIKDEFELENTAEITERFITRHKTVGTLNGADIIVENKTIARLTAGIDCKTNISLHKHREHDGRETEITVIDFTFDADRKTTFSLELK